MLGGLGGAITGMEAAGALGAMGYNPFASINPSELKTFTTSDKFESPLNLKSEAISTPVQERRVEPTAVENYYKYGTQPSLDEVMSVESSQYPKEILPEENYADGGSIMATPLMADGGFTGTRHGQYAGGGSTPLVMAAGGKNRVDFRHGDAVSGKGDGQSDDIPAMLADGEFVFPADVVSAIGNGSTKAGSDKLYETMHAIREEARSTKPKELPPPAKHPLEYLKRK
jgi:hypothetical protein